MSELSESSPGSLPGARESALFKQITTPERRAAALHEAWRRPKVELHLHLEGTLRPATVCELAGRHDPDSPLTRPDWQVGYWSFRDLASFVREFRVINRACVRDLSDLERLAREGFEDLAAQNVRYAEVSWSARTPGHPYYLPLRAAFGVIDRARREVEARTRLRVGLIVGVNRSPESVVAEEVRREAIALVEETIRARDDGLNLVGIDLHGDEQSQPHAEPFMDAFRLAAEAGLGLRAHAGEGAGPEVVRDAVERLGVNRIGHGVRAAGDPALVKRLAAAGTTLDLCPSSNILTGAVSSLEAHPIRRFLAAGIPVTIGSDDPIVFETSVTTELALLHLAHGFTWQELGELTVNAARASFLPATERDALARELSSAWP